jgi:hypothetical protein
VCDNPRRRTSHPVCDNARRWAGGAPLTLCVTTPGGAPLTFSKVRRWALSQTFCMLCCDFSFALLD